MTEWLRFRRRGPRDSLDAEQTDARPVAAHAAGRELAPELRSPLKLRRRALVLGLAAVCLAGSVAAFIGEGGFFDVRKLRRECAGLQADIERREAGIERLKLEVLRLEGDPLLRERVAREQLGLVRPGEIDFLLPRNGQAPWDAPPAATGPVPSRP